MDMAKPKILKGKALEREIERVYYENCRGVEIDIMDIGKIFKAGEEAYVKGESIKTAVVDLVAKLRKN
jgi:hypothetical protein